MYICRKLEKLNCLKPVNSQKVQTFFGGELLLITQSCLTLRPHGLQQVRLSRASPFPRMDTRTCMAESLLCSSQIITTLLIGYVKVKVAQSCPTLCNPMDYTVHGILQARILEWAAFRFSRGSSQPRDQTQASHIAGVFFTS